MGFSLSNLISYGTGSTAGVKDTSGVSSTAQVASDKGMAALKSMTPGETLQGEVVSVNGNQVEIKISEDAVISAKLEHSMGIAVGQKMMFEVQNNSNGQIALRALFTNLAQEQLAQNALQAAGIGQNSQSLQMIAGLMKEGMSIDRQSLQNVYHDIVQYPDTDQSLLVHMHKIGMETTPQNVEQFQALVNYEERVASTIHELINELPKELQNMSANGEAGKVMVVTQELFNMLAEQEGKLAGLQGEQSANVPTQMAEGEATVSQTVIGAQNGAEGVESAQSVMDKALAALQEAMNPENAVHTLADGEGNVLPDGTKITGQNGDIPNAAVQGQEASTVLNSNENVLSGVLTKAEYTELATLLKQNGFSQELVAQVKEGNIPMQELFTALKAELAGKDAMAASALWDNPAFSKLMGKELQKAWLLNPGEVENGQNVTEFYNRLNHQVNSIISSMSQSLAETSVLSQSLQQFQENVDFLNNLNQYMPYVQLPLKMNGQSATGDLFVYADKRSLASGKDTVSAALHLDMKYLGHLDVYVKMQNKNVTTEFCLENEETLDFLAEHMDMLSGRLERRGYHLDSKMKIKEVPSSVKEDILPVDAAESAEAVHTEDTIAIYRFDVRA